MHARSGKCKLFQLCISFSHNSDRAFSFRQPLTFCAMIDLGNECFIHFLCFSDVVVAWWSIMSVGFAMRIHHLDHFVNFFISIFFCYACRFDCNVCLWVVLTDCLVALDSPGKEDNEIWVRFLALRVIEVLFWLEIYMVVFINSTLINALIFEIIFYPCYDTCSYQHEYVGKMNG